MVREVFRAQVELGTVSHATLREEDLIPAFEDALESYGAALPDDRPAEAIDILADGGTLTDEQWQDIAFYLNESLVDALNEIAPDYCYFGAHPGDGSDFGFWPDWGAIDNDMHDGLLDRGEDVPRFPRDCPFLHVNDHGNATLYSADGTELWAVV